MRLMTKKSLTELLKTTAHKLTIDDHSDIADLDRIADEFYGAGSLERRMLSQPIEVGGIKFYPATAGKELWQKELIEDYEIPAHWHDLLTFWILTIPNTAEALDKNTGADIIHKLKRFSRKLHLTADDLDSVFRRCVGTPDAEQDEDDQKAEGTDEDATVDDRGAYGPMIELLINSFGNTPEYWLYECPIERIGEMLKALAARVAREEMEATKDKKATAKAPRVDHRIRAIAKFRKKLNAIEEKWTHGE